MEKIFEAYSKHTRAREARSAWLATNRGSAWLTSEEYRKLESAEYRTLQRFVSAVEDSEHFGMFEAYKHAPE
jgi:hypothetical protein